MTDRPQDDARRQVPAPGFDDPTRDIRLPPVPGRPAPAVPPEWAGLVHPPEPSPAPGADPVGHQPVLESPEPTAAPPARTRISDQPTDELNTPAAAVRQRTLAFTPPSPPADAATADGNAPAQGPPGYLPAGHPQPGAAPPKAAPARPASPPRRRSTWPWVLAVLVVLALFAAAVVLAWVGGEKDDLQSFWEAAAPLGHGPG
ncbi:MAG: hypothetical protein JWR82_2331 [Blastococcus sp.]|jgi:hypothetical protein|nr:hypothetical protein [Blastococcus sp.]